MSLLLGWPADRLFTINGRLARLNAARNPRRTATTASALMIGLAMVSLVTVLGTSFQADPERPTGGFGRGRLARLRQRMQHGSGHIQHCLGAFSPEATHRMSQMPELESVMAFRFRPDGARAPDGEQRRVTATDLDLFSRHVDPDVIAGSLSQAGTGDVLVHKDLADDLDIVVGDQLFLEFPGEQEETFEVVALHTEDSVVGPLVVDLSDWGQLMGEGQDNLTTAITAPGIDMDQARSSLESELSDFPQVIVKDEAEYREAELLKSTPSW